MLTDSMSTANPELALVGPGHAGSAAGLSVEGVGVRHVETVMGASFVFDVRDPRFHAASLDGAVAWLHWVDRTFNPERPDSAVSQLAAGTLEFGDVPDEVTEVFDLCVAMEKATDGYFSPLYGQGLDPSGLVKGWAVERASEMLVQAGSRAHCINGGGDIRVVGEAAPGRPWAIGVADPNRTGAVLTAVTGTDMAVATSGTAGRGRHINDPHTQSATSSTTASVTVVGPDLIRADAYATAAFAMGERAYDWLASLTDYSAVVVAADGTIWRTP
jgi:FAD:protein FMN transferase